MSSPQDMLAWCYGARLLGGRKGQSPQCLLPAGLLPPPRASRQQGLLALGVLSRGYGLGAHLGACVWSLGPNSGGICPHLWAVTGQNLVRDQKMPEMAPNFVQLILCFTKWTKLRD